MTKEELQGYIDQGLSIRGIAETIKKSQGSVKYWLRKYDLQTNHKQYNINNNPTRVCPRCEKEKDRSEFYDRRGKAGASPYCKPCTSQQVVERQRANKAWAVELLGGKCEDCDGVFHPAVFDFHHLDPSEKDFHFGRGHLKSRKTLKLELAKCALLCANCHRLRHADD